MSDWTILCDFDGTIAVEDVTDTLLERFAASGWQTLEGQWRRGEIGSRECMAGQVALIDASKRELDEHLENREVDPAFPAFVGAAVAARLRIEILSDGLDYAIRNLLAREGLGWLPVVANHLESTGPRGWRLRFPHASPGCRIASGTCKCAQAARAQNARGRVLLIGDGASDFCIAEVADFVFAKSHLIAHCRAKGIPHAPIENFADALSLLPSLIEGRLVAVPRPVPVQDAVSHA